MTTAELEIVFQARHGRACCPSHHDRSPSLSITPRVGRTLIHCHAGCTPQAVLAAVGLTLADLFDDPVGRGRSRVAPAVDPHLQALLAVVEAERRRCQRMAETFVRYADADLIRIDRRRAATWQREATARGPDDPTAWELVARAVEAARTADLLEALQEEEPA
jgi:hypothetical protein